MKLIWTKSKWTATDLDQKTIEFRIPFAGGIAEQIRELSANDSPDGLVAIQILTEVRGEHWAKRIRTIYSLSQETVDRIAQHPNQSVAQFQLE